MRGDTRINSHLNIVEMYMPIFFEFEIDEVMAAAFFVYI